MCVHELNTLATRNIDVTVIVLTNQDYAIISEEAEHSYDLDEMTDGWSRAPLSFDPIAERMGIDAMEAETPAEIESTVGEAVASDGPTLVVVPTDQMKPQTSQWITRAD